MTNHMPWPEENAAAWFARICPAESALLQGASIGGREGDLVRAARAEGRMSGIWNALQDAPNAEVYEYLRVIAAGEVALAQRVSTVRVVNDLVGEPIEDGEDYNVGWVEGVCDAAEFLEADPGATLDAMLDADADDPGPTDDDAEGEGPHPW